MGHKVIAQIAYDDLTPKTQQAVKQLLNSHPDYFPNSNTFIKASTWADEIRGNDISAFNHWHYMNKPYSPDKTAKTEQWDKQNVVWAIKQSERVLMSSVVSEFDKAWFLRFYIHLIGDIHQPLHCVELYNRQFPKGDMGGNRYQVRSNLGDNLHQVWDRGVGYFNRYRGTNRVQQIANKVRQDYPRQQLQSRLVRHKKPKSWSTESYQLATKFVYNTLESGSLTSAYRLEGKQLVAQQLALAGYRLADGLNAIFDPAQNTGIRVKRSAGG